MLGDLVCFPVDRGQPLLIQIFLYCEYDILLKIEIFLLNAGFHNLCLGFGQLNTSFALTPIENRNAYSQGNDLPVLQVLIRGGESCCTPCKAYGNIDVRLKTTVGPCLCNRLLRFKTAAIGIMRDRIIFMSTFYNFGQCDWDVGGFGWHGCFDDYPVIESKIIPQCEHAGIIILTGCYDGC